MQLTANYNLKKPEGTDPVDIQDFNDNADIVDEALKKKADVTGGDLSGMTVKTLDPVNTQFPVPEAGENSGTFLGKVKKFFMDTKNWMTGVCLIGQIVNNCVTNNAGLPLSAAQGKVLMDLYTKLNTDFTSWVSNKDILGYADTLDLGAHCINYNFDCTNKPSNVWGTAYIHVRAKSSEITIMAVDYDNMMYTTVKRSVSAAWTPWDRKVSTLDLQAKISFHRLTIIPTDNNPSTISRHILATAKNMDDNTAAIYLGDIPGYAYYRCITSRTKNIILGTINIHESQYQFAYDMITDKLGGNFS